MRGSLSLGTPGFHHSRSLPQFSHYDPPLSVPCGTVVSRFYCRRTFSHSSCEEERASFNPRLCKCSECPGKPVLQLLALKTPGHSNYQPGLSLLCSVKSSSTVVTIYSTTIPVTWVSSRLEHRASTVLNRFVFFAPRLRSQTAPNRSSSFSPQVLQTCGSPVGVVPIAPVAPQVLTTRLQVPSNPARIPLVHHSE